MNQLSIFGQAIPEMLDRLTIRKPGSGRRDTSIEAFHAHKNSGKLSRQQQLIMDWAAITSPWIFDARIGGWTRSEIAQRTGFRLSAICGRCNELIKLGKLIELPRRACRVTGKSAHPVRLA